MKKIVLAIAVVLFFAGSGPSYATSSIDALIQKLEDKGILNEKDAAQIKGEIAFDEQKSQQATFKSMLPDWLNTMKLTGDFRLRYQYQRRDLPSGGVVLPRNGGKYRGRLQFEDQVNDKFKVIFGIATDGGNPAVITSFLAATRVAMTLSGKVLLWPIKFMPPIRRQVF